MTPLELRAAASVENERRILRLSRAIHTSALYAGLQEQYLPPLYVAHLREWMTWMP